MAAASRMAYFNAHAAVAAAFMPHQLAAAVHHHHHHPHSHPHSHPHTHTHHHPHHPHQHHTQQQQQQQTPQPPPPLPAAMPMPPHHPLLHAQVTDRIIGNWFCHLHDTHTHTLTHTQNHLYKRRREPLSLHKKEINQRAHQTHTHAHIDNGSSCSF
ncbi:uncharacterized histidine-rich protein DDB_G0274557-like [Drosophila navojoa]|uniref:uncharacterized histidine-rich protein DDB_G0274557-like n=1 Tax=Drosophila navojoa TaxID=7232 RepID=UPI0011BE8195|nr:uncharacterized histidine-rich protein DDB_G0274557-like [Drosophila navojoa]